MIASDLVDDAAENVVLAAILVNPAVFKDIDLAVEDFFEPRHSALWRLMHELDDAGIPPSPDGDP